MILWYELGPMNLGDLGVLEVGIMSLLDIQRNSCH